MLWRARGIAAPRPFGLARRVRTSCRNPQKPSFQPLVFARDAWYRVPVSMSKNIRGITFALISGISWGFSGACAQYLFGHYGVDPIWVSSVRMLFAGIVLCCVAFIGFRGPFTALWKFWKTPRVALRLVVFAICGLAFCQITYLLAIQYSNAGTATIIQYIGPVMTVFFLCAVAHRAPTLREIIALVCVMAGIFLLSTHGNPAVMVLSPQALFWGLVSAFAYMLYSLLPRKLMVHYGSVPVVASGLIIGGVVFSVAIQSWANIPQMELSGFIVLFVGLVLFGTVVGFSLFFQSIKDIGAAKAGLIASIETVSATVFAVVWLGTSFVWIDIVGFVLIVATVFILAKHPGDPDAQGDVDMCQDARAE